MYSSPTAFLCAQLPAFVQGYDFPEYISHPIICSGQLLFVTSGYHDLEHTFCA
jgi:hypothetical protein